MTAFARPVASLGPVPMSVAALGAAGCARPRAPDWRHDTRPQGRYRVRVPGVVRNAVLPATPWVLGAAVVALGLGAALVGAMLAGTTDFGTATGLVLLRTTLGGLAVAAFPALVVAVVRTGRTRS